MDQTYSLNRACMPVTTRLVDLDGPDFYPTPPWATYALIDNERFVGDIWEPPAATARCPRCWRGPATR